MSPIQSKPRKTADDYMRLPEGVRAELIEGELLMSPSPREKHQAALLNLAVALREFILARKLGRLYVAPFDVHLPSGDIVQPDLVFVAAANQSIIRDWVRGVPELLVEIVSPESTDRDRIVKRHLYESVGVKEYWVVDPQEKTVEVLKLAGSQFVGHGYYEGGDSITSSLLEGLSLPARILFV